MPSPVFRGGVWLSRNERLCKVLARFAPMLRHARQHVLHYPKWPLLHLVKPWNGLRYCYQTGCPSNWFGTARFPWLWCVFGRRGLRRRIGIRKTNYVFGILTKRGPNHVFGWRIRYSDVFGRRIKHSDLSVRLPRLIVRLPGPPTPSEDILFVSGLLCQSSVGEWMLIGRLTRLRKALASNWVTLMSALNSSLKIHRWASILLPFCFEWKGVFVLLRFATVTYTFT